VVPRPVLVADSGRIRSGRLAGLTMNRAIFVLSWPILAESLMNSLVGLVDTTLAAGLSEAAADAIGGASYISWFLTLIGMSVGVGATALISRAIGRGRRAFADTAASQAILLAFITGAIIGAVTFFAAAEIARMLLLEGEAYAALVAYLRICAFGVPMISLLTAGAACCRAAGDALRPLLTMVGVNIVNVIVSWALSGVDIAVSSINEAGEFSRRVLVENPFNFNMGISGIAIGTLAAWALGGAVVTAWLVRGSPGVRIRAKRLKPNYFTMRRLIRVSTPNFAETFCMWFGNFLVLLMVGWMAIPGLLGAHIVAVRVEAFSFLPGFSMGLAAATLAGQYMGARRSDLAAVALRRSALLACAFMGCFGILFLTIPEQIVGLFTQQPSHLRTTPKIIQIAGAIQIPFAIMLVLRTGMRGAGDTKWAMILTWSSTYLIRIPAVYIFSGVDIPLPTWLPFASGQIIQNPSPFDLGLVGVWFALCGEICVRAILFSLRYLHGGWKNVRV
ncbi:MAG: MATE family efflux transporter, partial [Planctomycetota bacterium]|nr:MATE family efflux transporter [Planctomycetota bacterium]